MHAKICYFVALRIPIIALLKSSSLDMYLVTIILELVSLQSGIGIAVSAMLTELISDNRKIIDRITHNHIDLFIDLLSKRKVRFSYVDSLRL